MICTTLTFVAVLAVAHGSCSHYSCPPGHSCMGGECLPSGFSHPAPGHFDLLPPPFDRHYASALSLPMHGLEAAHAAEPQLQLAHAGLTEYNPSPVVVDGVARASGDQLHDFFLRTGDIITLKAQDGTYLKRFFPFPYRPYSGILSYNKHVDAFSKFKVTVVDGTKILLQAENGQYLKRFCCFRQRSVIAVYQNHPDPYSYFTVEPVSGGSIRLKAENGQYLKRVYWNDIGKSDIEVHSVKDVFGIFTVDVLNRDVSVKISDDLTVYTGDTITLEAQDGTFLKRYYPFPYGGYSGILSYNKFVDPFSKFKVTVTGPNKVLLQADNGQYLKRFCCFRQRSVIAIYQNFPDPYSYFTIEPEGGSASIRIKAENGQYLKRVYWNDLGKSDIEVHAVKDVFGIFKVAVV